MVERREDARQVHVLVAPVRVQDRARDLLAARYPLREPAGEHHHGERGDEWLHAEAGNHSAREQPAGRACQDHERDRGPRRPPEVDAEDGEDDRADAEDAANGEVDPAGDDHQGHPAGENPVNRDLPEHVTVRAPLEERPLRVEDRADDQDEAKGCERPHPGPLEGDPQDAFLPGNGLGVGARPAYVQEDFAVRGWRFVHTASSAMAAFRTFSWVASARPNRAVTRPRCITTMRSARPRSSGISEVIIRMAKPSLVHWVISS